MPTKRAMQAEIQCLRKKLKKNARLMLEASVKIEALEGLGVSIEAQKEIARKHLKTSKYHANGKATPHAQLKKLSRPKPIEVKTRKT